MAFDGYMKICLAGEDAITMAMKTEKTGDWTTQSKRIMKKPRRYCINLHMFDSLGNRAHDSIQFLEKGDVFILIDAVTQFANDFVANNPDVDIDLTKCTAVIRA